MPCEEAGLLASAGPTLANPAFGPHFNQTATYVRLEGGTVAGTRRAFSTPLALRVTRESIDHFSLAICTGRIIAQEPPTSMAKVTPCCGDLKQVLRLVTVDYAHTLWLSKHTPIWLSGMLRCTSLYTGYFCCFALVEARARPK
jgi:hypothetical protein